MLKFTKVISLAPRMALLCLAMVGFCREAGAAPVAVTIVDSSAGRPVPGAAVARIQSGDALPVAIGQTDKRGQIVLDCDPRARTAYLVTAPEPGLKDAWEGWAVDGRLTMVSASVNDTPEQVQKHVNEDQLNWTQLVLGPMTKTKIPRTFGIHCYPAIMLISPDGKFVRTLSSGELHEALIPLLGQPSPPRAATPAPSAH